MKMEIHTLDVGNGDCALVRYVAEGAEFFQLPGSNLIKNKLQFIIDGGRSGHTDKIVEYMRQYDFIGKIAGTTDEYHTIDGVFISHFDVDHSQGLIKILSLANHFPPDIYNAYLEKYRTVVDYHYKKITTDNVDFCYFFMLLYILVTTTRLEISEERFCSDYIYEFFIENDTNFETYLKNLNDNKYPNEPYKNLISYVMDNFCLMFEDFAQILRPEFMNIPRLQLALFFDGIFSPIIYQEPSIDNVICSILDTVSFVAKDADISLYSAFKNSVIVSSSPLWVDNTDIINILGVNPSEKFDASGVTRKWYVTDPNDVCGQIRDKFQDFKEHFSDFANKRFDMVDYGDASGVWNINPNCSDFNIEILMIDAGSGSNERSLALLFKCGDFAYYTAGDLPAELEQNFVDGNLRANVVKLSHHGAGSSTPWGLLETLQPEFIIISTDGNSYYHPRIETFQKIREYISVVDRFKKLFITTFASLTFKTDDNVNYYFYSYAYTDPNDSEKIIQYQKDVKGTVVYTNPEELTENVVLESVGTNDLGRDCLYYLFNNEPVYIDVRECEFDCYYRTYDCTYGLIEDDWFYEEEFNRDTVILDKKRAIRISYSSVRKESVAELTGGVGEDFEIIRFSDIIVNDSVNDSDADFFEV